MKITINKFDTKREQLNELISLIDKAEKAWNEVEECEINYIDSNDAYEKYQAIEVEYNHDFKTTSLLRL